MSKNNLQPHPVDHFQVIRGVACLMVVFNHLGGLLVPDAKASAPWYTPFLVPFGFPWVWLFLALSGFLLAKAFDVGRFELNFKGVQLFYIARFRRLFPLLWVSTLLWAALFGILSPINYWPQRLSWNWERELSVAFALPWGPYTSAYFPVNSVNSPVWSVIIEIHYCLMMPLLLFFFQRPAQQIGVFMVWSGYMTVLLISVIFSSEPTIFPRIYSAHLYNFGFFFTGMLIARLHLTSPFIKRLRWSTVISCFAVVLLGTQWVAFYNLNFALAAAPFFVLPVVFMLIVKSDRAFQVKTPKTMAEFLNVKSPLSILERIGIMSYSVYLLHKPLGYIVFQFIPQIESFSALGEYLIKMSAFVIPFLIVSTWFFYSVENRYRYKSRAIRE